MNSSTFISDVAPGWGRCIQAFLGVLALGALLVFGFLAAVDPYDSGRFGWLDIHGVADTGTTTANASRARDPQFDSAIIGDSTAQRLMPAELSKATGLHFVQLAVQGGVPFEQLAVLDFFIRHHRQIGAIVVAADTPWCTHDADLPSEHPFPYWLYRDGTLTYAQRIFSWRGIDHAIQRVLIGLGRQQRRPPDGTFNYEDVYPPEHHPRVKQAEPEPLFTGEIDAPFPMLEQLAARIAKLPADVSVILLVPPTFFTTVPSPGSRAAAEQDACDAALRAMVAGRRGNFIDYRVDNALTRDPQNFVDLVHYRAKIADKIQHGVAASIKFGDAVKIDF
jgi:hypothetical protein